MRTTWLPALRAKFQFLVFLSKPGACILFYHTLRPSYSVFRGRTVNFPLFSWHQEKPPPQDAPEREVFAVLISAVQHKGLYRFHQLHKLTICRDTPVHRTGTEQPNPETAVKSWQKARRARVPPSVFACPAYPQSRPHRRSALCGGATMKNGIRNREASLFPYSPLFLLFAPFLCVKALTFPPAYCKVFTVKASHSQ